MQFLQAESGESVECFREYTSIRPAGIMIAARSCMAGISELPLVAINVSFSWSIAVRYSSLHSAVERKCSSFLRNLPLLLAHRTWTVTGSHCCHSETVPPYKEVWLDRKWSLIARTQRLWENQCVSLGLTTLSCGKFRTPCISLRVSPFLGE